MRAGDRDAIAQAHQLGQHLGAANDGNAACVGRSHLGIAGRDGAGSDYDIEFTVEKIEVVRAVAFANLGSEAG